jgi:hypothetical protein
VSKRRVRVRSSRWLFGRKHYIVSCPVCGFLGLRISWSAAMAFANAHVRERKIKHLYSGKNYTLAGPS